MPKPNSQPMYVIASSVFAVRVTSGVPRHTGAASTATTASSSVKTGSASGSIRRAAANDAVTAAPATIASPRSIGRPACSNRRTSSHSAPTLATTTSASNIQLGALTTMTRNAGNNTSALARRFSTPDFRGASSATVAGIATSHPTEASVAALIIGNGAIEIGGTEVRPERRRHPELGVRDLPQQQIGNPHLAARSYQQIGIGHALGDRKSTRLNSSHPSISYAVFCL